MREIKFRGFNGEKWLFGNLDIDYKTKQAAISDDRWWRHPVRFETVGQFTGLKDHKGREIYEGDIVEAKLKDKSFVKRFNMNETIVGGISFDGAWWLGEWDALWRLPRYYDLTVIGNIHDSPELLGGHA